MKGSIHKLAFCFKITSGLASFFKLVWNSKKLRWSKSSLTTPSSDGEPVQISLLSGDQNFKCLLRPYDGDIDIFFEIWYREIYSLPGEIYKDAKSIVDLGANTGLAALYFLVKAPQARIYAVEPDHLNFKILTKNLEQFRARALCLEAAVNDKNGIVHFKSERMKYNSRIDAVGIPVTSISMNSLIDHFQLRHIDVLKIDIEGSESAIFSADLEWLQFVKNIIIEIHDATDLAGIEAALNKYGMVMQRLKNDATNEQLYWAKRS